MGLWEVTDDVLTKSDARHNVSRVPVYSHITHKALKDIPKEDTNPDNCKVRALAFNNKNKVWACQRSLKPIPLASVSWLMSWKMRFPSLFPSQNCITWFWAQAASLEDWGMLSNNLCLRKIITKITKPSPCSEYSLHGSRLLTSQFRQGHSDLSLICTWPCRCSVLGMIFLHAVTFFSLVFSFFSFFTASSQCFHQV